MHSRSRYERNRLFTGDSDKITVTGGGVDSGTVTIEPVLEAQAVVFAPGANNATGDGKYYLHVSKAMGGKDLAHVHAEVIVAGTTGVLTVQVHNLTTAADMLSTELTVDTGETGSDTASAPHVVDASEDDVAENDVLRIDVDTVHTTPAVGLILTLQFK
jgi:hypothetical protein